MIRLYKLITYSGAVTFLFLTSTVFLGITRLNFRLHKLAGIWTLIFASIHLSLVLYKNLRKR